MPQYSQRDEGRHSHRSRPSASPPPYRIMLSRTKLPKENNAADSGLEPVAAVSRDESLGDAVVALSGAFCPNLPTTTLPPPTSFRNAHGQTAMEPLEGLERFDRELFGFQNGDSIKVTDATVGGNIEYRLKEAIAAKTKWQQKYEAKNQANEELTRRVRSWKSAYMLEVSKREALEKQLEDIRQASATRMESYRHDLRRLATVLLRDPMDPSNSSHVCGQEESKPPYSPMRGFTTAGGGSRPPAYPNEVVKMERSMASDPKLSSPGHLPLISWVHQEDPRLPRRKYGGNYAPRENTGRLFHPCKAPFAVNNNAAVEMTSCIPASHTEVPNEPKVADEDDDDLCGIPRTNSERSTIQPYWAPSWEKYSDRYEETPSRDPSTDEPDSLRSIFGGCDDDRCDRIHVGGDENFDGDDTIGASMPSNRYSNTGVSRLRLGLKINTKPTPQSSTNTNTVSNPPSSRKLRCKRSVTVAAKSAPMTSGKRIPEIGMAAITDIKPGEEIGVKWSLANARGSSVKNTPAVKNGKGKCTGGFYLKRVDPCDLQDQDASLEEEELSKRSPVVDEGSAETWSERSHSEDSDDRIDHEGDGNVGEDFDHPYYNEDSGRSGSWSPGSSSCKSKADSDSIEPSFSPEHDSTSSVEDDDDATMITSSSRGSSSPAVEPSIPTLVKRESPVRCPSLGGSSSARCQSGDEAVNESIADDSHDRVGGIMKRSRRQPPCDGGSGGSGGISASSLDRHCGAPNLSDEGLDRVNVASHRPCSRKDIRCGKYSELSMETSARLKGASVPAHLIIGTVASVAGDGTANGVNRTMTRCELTNERKPTAELPESRPRITEIFRATLPSESTANTSNRRTTLPSEGPRGCAAMEDDDGSLVLSPGSDKSPGMYSGMQAPVGSMDRSNSGFPPAESSSSTEDAVPVGPVKVEVFCEKKRDPCDSPRLFDSLLSVGVPDNWDFCSVTTNNTSLKKSPRVKEDSARNKVTTPRAGRAVGGASKWIRSVFPARTVSKETLARQSSTSDLPSSTSTDTLTATTKPSLSVRKHCRRRTDAAYRKGGSATGAEKAKPVPNCTVSGRLVPQVLAQYPPEVPLPCINVADYCFPQGVRATTIDTRATQSSINKVEPEILLQPGTCERGSQSFIFMFSGDQEAGGAGKGRNNRIYGVCVTYPKVSQRSPCNGETSPVASKAEEKLPDICGTLPQTKSTHPWGGSNGGGGLDIEVRGCYCLLTRLPFFDLHFQVLWDLLAAERVMRMQMIAQRSGRSTTPTEEVAEATLLTSRMMELLETFSQRYIRLAVPAPGETVRLMVHPDLPEICYRTSSSVEIGGKQIDDRGVVRAFGYDIFAELPTSALPAHVASVAEMIDAVVAWALPGTLSRVPLDVLLTAVGALMCEYQVIVTSENLGLLSSAVFALAALTRPLVWVHPMVPVMPTNMREMLSAPVPYLIGTPRLEGAERENSQAQLSAGQAEGFSYNECNLPGKQVLIDADEKKVIFAHPRDASDAKLPRSRALLTRLEPLEKVLCEGKGTANEENPLHFVSGAQAAASEVVQATVAAHIACVCASALRHYDGIVSSPTTPKSTPNKTTSQSPDLPEPGVVAEKVSEERDTNGINEESHIIYKTATTDGSAAVSRDDLASPFTVDRQNGSRSWMTGSIGENGKWEIGIADEDSAEWDEDEGNGSKALADGCEAAGAGQGACWRGGRLRTSDLPFLRLLVRSQAFEVYRGATKAARDAEKISVEPTPTG